MFAAGELVVAGVAVLEHGFVVFAGGGVIFGFSGAVKLAAEVANKEAVFYPVGGVFFGWA